ncbi:hypothetical protein PITC_086180 [Penicillium italicum]|uniref:Uncharacterized protein n=1 Tax=Penicillium italicum TaxID=40296 RepID=A0A0A2L9N6_PENIT|nr:hypothetical protein PITC_086180 [Penicillium italicum]
MRLVLSPKLYRDNKEKEPTITEAAIKARSIQIAASNLELRKRHTDAEEKGERADNRTFLQFVSSLGPKAPLHGWSYHQHIHGCEVYLELKDVYWNSSQIATYNRG